MNALKGINRHLLTSILLSLALTLPAAAQIVGTAQFYNSGSTYNTSHSLTLSQATAAGNTIVACFADTSRASAAISSITDNASDTFTLAPDDSANGATTECYKAVTAGGATTVTFNFAYSTFGLFAVELHVGALDATAKSPDGGYVSYSSSADGSVTTTAANDVLIAWWWSNGSATTSAGSGWTGQGGFGSAGPAAESMTAGAAGSYSASLSGTTAYSYYNQAILAFKPAGASTPCVPTLALLGVGGSCG